MRSPGASRRALARARSSLSPDRFRSYHGPCDECGATAGQWCAPECTLIDPMDYR